MKKMLVKIRIVPCPIGKMDVRRVCVLVMEMPRGVMEVRVATMILTIRNMKRTHLVIAIKETGNAIRILNQRIGIARGIGSVRVD